MLLVVGLVEIKTVEVAALGVCCQVLAYCLIQIQFIPLPLALVGHQTHLRLEATVQTLLFLLLHLLAAAAGDTQLLQSAVVAAVAATHLLARRELMVKGLLAVMVALQVETLQAVAVAVRVQ